MSNTFPSANPADDGSLTGVVKTAVAKAMQNFDVMMPVEVVAYDRAKNRATVKHLVQMVATDGTAVDRAPVSSIRVMQPGNGKYSVSFPIKPGDRGWLMAADRDISLFQQDLKSGAPNTRRMHSFSDGVFMPDAMGMGDVPAPEGDRAVLGANGGSAYISFDENGVYFTAGGVSVAITGAGVAVTGGTLTHNGKNVGDTHRHGGVTPGGSNTAVPV